MRDYSLSELSSGVRVVSERIDSVRSIALGFWVGTGSRDESPSRAGVSHFIEHLLFKGSDRYDAQQIAEIFDTLGGDLNAATSRETTVVYARVPDEQVELALDVMVDMVFRPRLSEVDSEREVVLEEIAMVEDNPQDLVHDLAAQAVFGGHPLGRPVIGSADVISTVSRRALQSYHRRAYVGANVVVASAGNLEHGRLLELLSARVDEARRELRLARRAVSRMPAPGARFLEKDTEQYHVCLAGPGIRRADERRYAASLLDAIVGGSASSRLFQEIREKRGMAYSVYTFGSQYADSGLVGLYVGTREENLTECLEIAAAELVDVASGNLRPGELERAKENMKGRLLLSLESTSARMTRLGKALVTDIEITSIDETIARIEAVSEPDVAALAAELLSPGTLSAAGIGPSEERFRAAVERVNPTALVRAA
ncbi:MAG TPA: pitrilysin family protein [Gaiellaceae bacterium]|nr:pitrilysin family protein [Gaiellaceae bacterium]